MPRWTALPDELEPRVREFTVELRQLVDSGGLNLADLAERSGYAKASWDRYLSGELLAPKGAVIALAEITGAGTDRLTTLWELAEQDWRRAESGRPLIAGQRRSPEDGDVSDAVNSWNVAGYRGPATGGVSWGAVPGGSGTSGGSGGSGGSGTAGGARGSRGAGGVSAGGRGASEGASGAWPEVPSGADPRYRTGSVPLSGSITGPRRLGTVGIPLPPEAVSAPRTVASGADAASTPVPAPGPRSPSAPAPGSASASGSGDADNGGVGRRTVLFLAGAVGALAVVAGVFLLTGRFSGTDDRAAPPQPRSDRPAVPSPPPGVKCAGTGCTGRDAEVMGCSGESVRTARSVAVGGAVLEIRYSALCRAAWGRVTGGGRGDHVRITVGRDHQDDTAGPGESIAYTPMLAVKDVRRAKACATLADGRTACTP
ncbi:DUF2690 domain-containing protein [Streptomyces sp. J2-1]|uniref:DUF2690 domain-containing protein n=1 Tax=Streptomyces corallincola TaxID=2851888 RepID=UPI001C38D0F4|nr:DUF2690 domain-containing protein [Streptomyces corallincola]MBV2355796.1 DUF2690 domain-containing protein [Streptomyces corallincola]